jgi:hypothetical protein
MNAALPQIDHRQAAHCESGAMTGLLRQAGFDLDEAMVFGLASGMSFAYIPLVKLGGLPLIAYRMPPRAIIKTLCRRLNIEMRFETFRSAAAGTAALDAHLQNGRVVGLQTSVYWLPYFPPDMRFHFNAHNLLAYGKSARGDYLISDPTFDTVKECDAQSLQRARFVKGALAPKGLIYYPLRVPAQLDLASAARKSIKFTCGMMLKTPLPVVGVRGIRTVATRIRQLPSAQPDANKLFIGHMVRMQEEIGTGGAGFRFMYASFLQQSADLLQQPALREASTMLTNAGDEWRRFALLAAKMCKDRMALDCDKLADQLLHCAELETEVYRFLGGLKL